MVCSGCARIWKICFLAIGLLLAGSRGESADRFFTTAEAKALSTNSIRLILPIRLEGVVLWVSPTKDRLYLQQEANPVLVEMDFRKWELKSTDQIRIEGESLVRDYGTRFTFASLPVVDNDGLHADIERSGQIYLTAGRHRFQAGYFNRYGDFAFTVHMQGPDSAKQVIPVDILSHETSSPEAKSWSKGVAYRTFEGKWNRLPDFSTLKPVAEGVVPEFDLSVRSRSEFVGIEYTGAIEIAQEGFYTFFTSSDDGSLFSFENSSPATLQILGTGQIPTPRRISLSRSLNDDENALWATVYGDVFYAGLGQSGWELELRSGTGRMRVQMPSITGQVPEYLLKARVRATGIAQSVRSTDGRVAGELLLPDLAHLGLISVPSQLWNNLPITRIDQLEFVGRGVEFVRVQGQVKSFDPDGGQMEISDGPAVLRVDSINRLPDKTGLRLEVIGRLNRSQNPRSLQWAVFRELAESQTDRTALPILTTIEQAHRLKKEEAIQRYTVRVQGVVTWAKPGEADGVVQDSTRGIFVSDLAPSPTDTPRIGDFVELQGETDSGDFTPILTASRVRILDRGRVPEPLRPEWEQLMNGSLDSQLVELAGTVTMVKADQLTLMTSGGSLRVQTEQFSPEHLKQYENAEIRMRGVLLADWDQDSHQLRSGLVHMLCHSIQLEQPAPRDLFDLPTRKIAEFLQFNPATKGSRRVKLSGQIIYAANSHYRLSDSSGGIRMVPRISTALSLGDHVEAVGFIHRGSSAPVIQEAEVRKIAPGSLPAPINLTPIELFHPRFDSTLVQLDCIVVDHRREGAEDVLEVRVGADVIKARIPALDSSVSRIGPGSKLRMAGVYSSREQSLGSSERPNDFEILLNSWQDVQVLSRPSWWTSERSFSVFGSLALIMVGSLAWIHTLRRRVETRTRQLRHEVEERKQAEAQARRAREEAEIANRAKSQFLANMSHEIRTPMNGVVGMTTLLLQTPLAAEQRDYAETVRDSGEALLTIINDILDFSKVESGKLQLERAPLHLREIIESALELIAPQAHAKNLELTCVFDPDTPTEFYGDAGRLRQILLNLAGNAVKFTKQGEVVLTVGSALQTENEVQLRFALRDTGVGIAPEALPNLFQPFVQADGSTTRQFGGTGLGLAISRRLVESMRGAICVQSRVGQGSVFTFTVTLERNLAAQALNVELPDSAQNARVLVLEENASAADSLRENLAACGVKLDAIASTHEKALALLCEARAGGRPFSILFATRKHLTRGGINSFRSDPGCTDLKIVALTCHTDRLKPEELKQLRIDEALTKPVQLGRLQRVLLQLLKPAILEPLTDPVLTPARDKSRLRILLAEDNPVNQKVALRQLQKLGYQAETAANGIEVLHRLETADFDLILMDCDMPGLDGYEATRRIRRQENDRHIQIVAMTANAMQGDREKCLAVGMDNYIAKPTRLAELQTILESASAQCATAEQNN